MKTVLKAAAIALAVAVIATGIIFGVLNSKGLNYDISSVENIGSSVQIISATRDSLGIQKNGKGKFKVLMFTDVHLNGKRKEDKLAASYIIKNITEVKPDLVIFGGDTISSGFNKKRTKEFVEMMDKTGVYWTAVLGNHESEGIFTFTREEFIETFISAERCLLKHEAEAGVDGYGNCTINIFNKDGSLKEVFFLLDSGNYMTKELKEKYGVEKKGQVYDGVKESQVKWYKEQHDELTERYGSFKSIAVIHIPLYQTKDATEKDFLYGEKNENTCQSGFDSGLFDALKEKGSTQAVYFGHDHINTFGFMHDGLLLSYIQPSGYGSYTMESSLDAPESKWLQGCTLLTLNNDGTYEAKVIYNHR